MLYTILSRVDVWRHRHRPPNFTTGETTLPGVNRSRQVESQLEHSAVIKECQLQYLPINFYQRRVVDCELDIGKHGYYTLISLLYLAMRTYIEHVVPA